MYLSFASIALTNISLLLTSFITSTSLTTSTTFPFFISMLFTTVSPLTNKSSHPNSRWIGNDCA